LNIRRAGLTLGAPLLGAVGAMPAKAESVPASFDCARASNTIEKFICAQAVLRWQDLALSRDYRAARNAATGAARDELLTGQDEDAPERFCLARLSKPESNK
jgi:uncharacterized protein